MQMGEWMTIAEGAARLGKKQDTFRKLGDRNGWEKKVEEGRTRYRIPDEVLSASKPTEAATPVGVLGATPTSREVELEAQLDVARSELASARKEIEINQLEIAAARAQADIERGKHDAVVEQQAKEREEHAITHINLLALEAMHSNGLIYFDIENPRTNRSPHEEIIYKDKIKEFEEMVQRQQATIDTLQEKNQKMSYLLKCIHARDDSYRALGFFKRMFARLPKVFF